MLTLECVMISTVACTITEEVSKWQKTVHLILPLYTTGLFIAFYKIFSDDRQHQLSCNTEKDRVGRKNHWTAGALCNLIVLTQTT